MSAAVRDALASGAELAEIAEALGVRVNEVRALAELAPEPAPAEQVSSAADTVRHQITRAERNIDAAEAAGDTTGARVWAGIVARLVPLLVRAEQDREDGVLGITHADLTAAEAYVRELAERAVEGGRGGDK